MNDVIFSRLDQVDWTTTHKKVTVLNHVDQLSQHEQGIFLLADGNLAAASNQNIYIPINELSNFDQQQLSLFTYFDLENYPFFQKAKEVIENEQQRKGVFRFRRMVKKSKDVSLLAGDLYVLAKLFGEPEDISVKKTDLTKRPTHVIVLVNFGGGTMAHIEHTVANHERIELEWSGMEQIIEFDSDEMSPVQPSEKTSLPLTYSIDSVLETAYKVDESLMEKINKYNEVINGGGQS